MNNKAIKIYHQNVRGLNSKINEFRYQVNNTEYDIIALTETWLNCDVNSSELFNDKYNVFRHDRKYNRNVTRGGGCLIACRSNLSVSHLIDWENECNFENVWISLGLSDNSTNKIYINTVYILPNASFDDYKNYLDMIAEKVNCLAPNSQFLILGDFNLPSIKWFQGSNNCLALEFEGRTANELINFMEFTNLNQFNYFKNRIDRTLDLVFSNLGNITIGKPSELLIFEDNYHPAIEINLANEKIKFIKNNRSVRHNFIKGNYDKLNSELSKIDWKSLLNYQDVDNTLEKFYEIVNPIIHNNLPTIKSIKSTYPIWYTDNLKKMLNEKYKCKQKFKKTNDNTYLTKFKELRKKIKYEQRICFSNYQNNIENNIKTNSKAFFAYTKSLQQTNSIPNSMSYNNNQSDDPSLIANYFADYFEKVYEKPDPNEQPIIPPCNCNDHIEVSINEIKESITSFNINKNNSPDRIPIAFYKNTIDQIVHPLKLIYHI